MSIRDLLRAVRRHLVLFAACTVVVLAVGGYVASSATPTYEAQTELLVSGNGTGSVDSLLQNNNLVQTRVRSYLALANSPLVVEPVVQRLGWHESAAAVAQRIQASNPLETALIDITVRATTAQAAYDLAAMTGQVFPTVVERVERSSNGTSPVKVTVVRPPVLPSGPVSSGRWQRLALSLLLGVALGGTAAVLRDLTDSSVKEAEDLRRTLGLPPLATIHVGSRVDRVPLVVDSGSAPAAAEGFRQLRTKVQVLASAEQLRSVLVTGSFHDDAASAVARNLAVALGLAQLRVVLVEANLRNSRMARLLGIDGVVGLSDVLAGTVEVERAIQPWRDGTVDVLPAGPVPANPGELLASPAMTELIGKLQGMYELILVYAPPVLRVADAAVLATRAHAVLLTVRRGRTRRDAVSRSVQVLDDVNARILGAVVLDKPTLRARLGALHRTKAGEHLPAELVPPEWMPWAGQPPPWQPDPDGGSGAPVEPEFAQWIVRAQVRPIGTTDGRRLAEPPAPDPEGTGTDG